MMNLRAWFKKIKNKLGSPKREEPELPPHLEGADLEDLPWWGSFQIGKEQSHYSRIGDIIVCIDRFSQEWHLASYRERAVNEQQEIKKTVSAYSEQDTVTLKPVLPNRTTIFKLDCPLFIPAETELTLYTCTPILIHFEIGSPLSFWEEISTEVLPDTWRGGNTQEGELCYAAHTFASLRLDNMQIGTRHATTPLSIHNKTDEGMFLKEISIPSPFLSIYANADHQLWTEQVKLFFEEIDQPQTLLAQGPPKIIKDAALISNARVYVKTGLKKLFSTLRGNL